LTAVNSTPNDGATDWIAPNWPIPEEAASRRTAALVTRGAISLSNSSHFAPVFERAETGSIASRMRQAVDETGADRVDDIHEHNRHGASRL